MQMKRLAPLVGAACVGTSLTVIALPQSLAAAYKVFGDCKFSSASITYAQHSNYATASKNAIAAWNGTATPIYFSAVSSGYMFSIISQDNGDNGYDGYTYRTCGSNGHYATSPVSAYNTYYTVNYNSTARKQLMVHEIGHALGLAHSGTATCSGQPIMYPSSSRYFTCGHQNPQPDDVNGVNSLY